MLKQRVLSGAMLTIIVAAVLLLSGYSLVMKCMSIFLSIMAAWELCRTGGYLQNKAFSFGCLAVSVLLAICADASFAGVLLAAALLGALYLMKQMRKIPKLPEWLVLLAAAISGYFFGLLGALRNQDAGFLLLTTAILIPVITDTGAYCFGRAFGKHKLAPIISPKKTWEGSVGGAACTVLLLAAAAFVLQYLGALRLRFRLLILYLLAGSVISQIGDLTFSALKRIAGIKDYGTLIPGHGGILDRFDSLVFVIPFTVCVDHYFGPLFTLV